MKAKHNHSARKSHVKTKKVAKKQNGIAKSTKNNSSWQKVKLAGNLISDDGGKGLEGLLGLEVLESYDDASVTKAKFERAKVSLKLPTP